MGDYTILSLDLASVTGYAVGRNGIVIDSGEVPLKPPGQTHPGHRFMKFQRFIHALHDRHKFNEVVYEKAVRFESAPAWLVYGGLLAQLHMFTLGFELLSRNLNVQTIKKEFTGSGRAKKEQMCEVAINLGWRNGARGTAINNNECDAIALLWCIYKRRAVEPRFLQGMSPVEQILGVDGLRLPAVP